MSLFSVSHALETASHTESRIRTRSQHAANEAVVDQRSPQASGSDTVATPTNSRGTKRRATSTLDVPDAKRHNRGASLPTQSPADPLRESTNFVELYDAKVKSKIDHTVTTAHEQTRLHAAQELQQARNGQPLGMVSGPTNWKNLRKGADSGQLHAMVQGSAAAAGMSDIKTEAVAKLLFDRDQLRHLQKRISDTDQPTGLDQIFSKYRGKQSTFQRHVNQVEITAVMTAHPSEVRSRPGQEAQFHLGRIMNTAPKQTSEERENKTHRLTENIKLFNSANYGKATPLARPTVSEEVDNLIENCKRSIFTGFGKHLARVKELNSATFGNEAPSLPRYTSLHSWVGGDRDGNPNVTHEETLTAGRRMRKAVIGHYRSELSQARADLGRADSAHQMHDRILAIEDKLINTSEARREIVNTVHGPVHRYYKNARELQHDLSNVIHDAKHAGDTTLVAQLSNVDNLVGVFGLHLASLEWRQHSGHVLKTISELAFQNDGHSSIDLKAPIEQVDDSVKNILMSHKNLLNGDESKLSSDAIELLASLRALATLQHESGNTAVTELIVANTDSAAPILALQRLVNEVSVPVKTGLKQDGSDKKFGIREVQIVPLFESIDSLRNAPKIVAELLDHPAFGAHIDKLDKRFEMMVGYSDSAKDGGRFASDVEVRNAQIAIAEVCAARGIQPLFFHGRGGSLGRGSAEPDEAFEPLSPLIPAGKLKQTEQGETVANRFGDPDRAAHYLDRCFVEAMNAIEKNEAAQQRPLSASGSGQRMHEVHQMVARMAVTARTSYQELFDRPSYAADYHALTAIELVRTLTISARPSQRAGSGFDVSNLRAVPYNMGANAAFAPFLSWYGTGSAIQHEIQQGNLQHLARAYKDQPTFRHSIDRAMKAFESTDFTGLARNLRIENMQPAIAENPIIYSSEEDKNKATLSAILHRQDVREIFSQTTFLGSLRHEAQNVKDGLNAILAAAGSEKRVAALSDTMPHANTVAFERASDRRVITEIMHSLRVRNEQGTLRGRTAPQTAIAAAVSHAGVSG